MLYVLFMIHGIPYKPAPAHRDEFPSVDIDVYRATYIVTSIPNPALLLDVFYSAGPIVHHCCMDYRFEPTDSRLQCAKILSLIWLPFRNLGYVQ